MEKGWPPKTIFKGLINLNMETASQIYTQLSKKELLVDQDYKKMWHQLLKSAVYYANIRSEWFLKNQKEKMESDHIRTMAHDTFIDSCNILARYMKTNGMDDSWREKIGHDRKDIGDFGCYISCILGIASR